MSYPDYPALPRGIRKMVVASESFFFCEARSKTQNPGRAALPGKAPPEPMTELDFAE